MTYQVSSAMTGDIGMGTGQKFLMGLSHLLGIAYFLCWSLSFYPQPIYNWQRRSTYGLAIDFPTCNVLGFIAYTIHTSALLFSPVIRSQYGARHPTAPNPTVRYNDLLFAGHSMILCIIIYTQFWPRIWGFQVSPKQTTSTPVRFLIWGSIASVVVFSIFIRIFSRNEGQDPTDWAWIDVIYLLGYIKLLITIVKYIPQAWVNYKRKSTTGWDIRPILLDLSGGIFSLLQLVIDSSLQSDWSGLTGNPAKFGLSNVSILFDILFILQHYYFYRTNRGKPNEDEDEEEEQDERQRLLD